MTFLLRAKHWQLFSLTFSVIILNFVLMIFWNGNFIFAFPLTCLFSFLIFSAWIWAVNTGLQKKLPEGVVMKATKFRLFFILPIIAFPYFIYELYASDYDAVDVKPLPFKEMILSIILLLSMLSVLYGINHAAKILKTIELGRIAKFDEYFGEVILICLVFFGYWVLQPQINEIYARQSNPGLTQ